MPFNIVHSTGKIQGVVLKHCRRFPDGRGSFAEVFRSEWYRSAGFNDEIQMNLSRSDRGSMRGLHFHHRQSDWWIPVTGTLQVALADLRKGSPTYIKTQVFNLGSDDCVCVLIPPGVAHGFLALTDVNLVYAVNRYYDGSDEQGVAWNDPSLNIPWQFPDPVLSDRDKNNPEVKELENSGLLPAYSD
jgi:dTDP-4-dehydrorhamnose 3,5-epimerase